MTLRPRIRDTIPYRHRTPVKLAISARSVAPHTGVSRAELVYITPLEEQVMRPRKQGYLALRDPTGGIYLLKEDSPFKKVRIQPLRDKYLLLLLQNRIIEDIQQRVSKSNHKGIERLFHACVKNIKVEKAVFDGSMQLWN